jgi:hypothetical protein
MERILYLCIACDADSDINPPFRSFPSEQDRKAIWQGCVSGIPALRQRLQACRFVKTHGQPPITWLVRSDRQVYELYDDAAFCLRELEATWDQERRFGSEIGWHPHLYRWDERSRTWKSSLGGDDDLEMLADCIASLRQLTEIRAVRTGWIYHSNNLLSFFDRVGLTVDASAAPGCVHKTEVSSYNWAGTPRWPYFPSRADYRRPATEGESSLGILEMPVLVRRLRHSLHVGRYCLRTMRAVRRWHFDAAEWESARWQGILVTMGTKPFREAAEQTLMLGLAEGTVFLTTYFHTDQLTPKTLELFAQNLDSLAFLASQFGYSIVPSTLSPSGDVARRGRLPVKPQIDSHSALV